MHKTSECGMPKLTTLHGKEFLLSNQTHLEYFPILFIWEFWKPSVDPNLDHQLFLKLENQDLEFCQTLSHFKQMHHHSIAFLLGLKINQDFCFSYLVLKIMPERQLLGIQ